MVEYGIEDRNLALAVVTVGMRKMVKLVRCHGGLRAAVFMLEYLLGLCGWSWCEWAMAHGECGFDCDDGGN